MQFALKFPGVAWCYVVVKEDAHRVIANDLNIKTGLYKVGDTNDPNSCWTKRMSAPVADQIYGCDLTKCNLLQGRLYTGFVYIEDVNGFSDSETGLYEKVPIVLDKSNSFTNTPILVGTPTTDGASVFMGVARPAGHRAL